MGKSIDSSCVGVPWQASWPCFTLNIKDKLLAVSQAPEFIPQSSPRKLTEEAVYMIYVMLVFVGLAVLGTSVTAYEFFFKDNEKKPESYRSGLNDKIAKGKMRKLKEKEFTESNGFLEASKSFLKCFCLMHNTRKILSLTPREGDIGCFHGLRYLINICIISGHTLTLYVSTASNLHKLKSLLDSRAFHILSNGMIAVDIFYIISGFLNAKSFFEMYSRRNGNIPWTYFYFKRFIRLTPMYMIVLGFYTTLFSYTGNGNLWPTYDTNPVCQKDWWWHLFYINNFEESAKMCLPCCWALAADMQFYIISPLFMLLLIRRPRIGYALTFACILGSCVISSVLTYQYNLIDSVNRIELSLENAKHFIIRFWDYFDLVHVKPYTRIIPYLIAILLAYYLHKKNINNDTSRDNTMTLSCGWIFTFTSLWFCCLFLYKRDEVLMVSVLYNGIKHLVFSCATAWVIYVCLTGQSEILNKCLSWKLFLPVSRLSYGTYLVHPLLTARIVLQVKNELDFNYTTLNGLLLHILGISFVGSFILTIFVGAPATNLLDWFKEKKEMKNSPVHLD